MKLRTMAILLAVGALSVAACGDDITNIIEEVVPTPVPTDGTPPTQVPTPTAPSTDPTDTPTPPIECMEPEEGEEVVCGDGVCHTPEQCDIGGICVGGENALAACTSPDDCDGGRCTVVGGQPAAGGSCAANCTLETTRTANYAPGTGAVVQTLSFAVPVSLTGSQTFQSGAARADDTVDVNGEVTFAAGDYPIIAKSEGIDIDPASVLGLVCACVRGIEVPAFGAGNSSTGLISCGGALDDVDYLMTQDHHTDPLDGFVPNAECSHDPDPECDDTFEIVPGVLSRSCREQEDPECNEPMENRHAGVCNSPRNVAFSGSGATGSALIFQQTAIGLLSDRGECDMGLAGMSPCPFADYGPDCIPCTDDDLDLGVPENNPTTTGMAAAAVYNAGNRANSTITEGSGTACTDSAQCTESVCGVAESCIPVNPAEPTGERICGLRCGSLPCQTSATGNPFSCQQLNDNANGGLGGGAFAVAFPSIDAATISDNVTSVSFVFQ
jgi:hypothetical protein